MELVTSENMTLALREVVELAARLRRTMTPRSMALLTPLCDQAAKV